MLGSNVPTRGGLPVGFKYADKWGCECIQVYITPSRTWNVATLAREEIASFKNAWKTSIVKKVVAHVPFLVNLASKQPDLRKKSRSRLLIELKRAEEFGVSYLVLHPGSNRHRKEGIEFIAEGVNEALEKLGSSKTKILLETMAGQGNVIGYQFEELAQIIDHCHKSELVGVCFDTCHVFAAGYDIRGYDGIKKVLEQFNEIVGLKKAHVFHINDSKTSLGSRKDRHAAIREGLLGLQAFHYIITDQLFESVPKILEIPERDEKSESALKLLKKLRMRKEPILERQRRPKQLSLNILTTSSKKQ